MDLSVKQLASLDDLKLYQILEKKLRKLTISYGYTNITHEELLNIVKIYKLYLNKIKGKKSTITNSDIDKQLESIIINIINEMNKESDDFINLVNNYINQNIEFNTFYEANVSEFNKLTNYFKKFDYIPDLDQIVIFMKNDDLNNILKSIYDNKEKIKKNCIEKISNEQILQSFIEAYCLINSIEEEQEDFDTSEDGFYSSEDSVGVYLKELSQYKVLTVNEERELLYRVKMGDEKAKKIFIESNLRLVIPVAKYYQGKGLDFLDLIQEGNLGLMKALTKFDVARGYKFSTYSRWWIRQSIVRALADKGHTVRLSVHATERLKKIKRIRLKCLTETGVEPSYEELANLTGIPLDEIRMVLSVSDAPISFSTPTTEDEKSTLFDLLADEDARTPEEEYMSKAKVEELRNYLGLLTSKEQFVMSERFGLDSDNGPKTLEEVASLLGVTRERVRQIEAKALRKLRTNYSRRS